MCLPLLQERICIPVILGALGCVQCRASTAAASPVREGFHVSLKSMDHGANAT